MSLFATKPIDKIIAESQEQGEHTLKRTLGATALTMLGVGAIIGTGIFVLTGQAAAKHAGPAVIISMILAGVVSALAALCYSEFASSVPISGSAYAYGYATLGEFIAWTIGWDLILEYAFGAATVAVGWSGYVVRLLNSFGITFPINFSAAPGTKFVNLSPEMVNRLGQVMVDGKPFSIPPGWNTVNTSLLDVMSQAGLSGLPTETAYFNLPAFLIAVAVTALLVKGIKESANFNSVIVVVKIAVVVLFIVAGIGYVNTANFTPFIPQEQGPGIFGYSGILTGAAVIFFAYVGFDAVSTAAQEAKNPQRDMPRGIIGSLLICTVLYVLVAAVMVGLVSYTQLNVPAPIGVAIDSALQKAQGTPFGAIFQAFPMIINIGAVLGLSSTMVVMVLGQPRVFYSMGKDGLLPAWAAKVHPRFRTPHITTMITGTIVAIMAGTVNVSILGELVSIGTLFAFVIVSTGVIVLRYTNPNLTRPFKVPFSPVIPIAAAAASAYLMNGLPLDTWLRLIVWMSIGLVIYFAYSYMHSNLAGGISDSAENYGSADANPVTGKAPLSPMIAILSAVVLTIYMFAFTDEPGFERLVNTSIRLFVWVSMGVLIYYLMYQNRSREAMAQPRDPQTARTGLMLSGLNLLVWLGVAYWYVRHFAELHNK